MYIVAKTKKEYCFIYSNKTAILCKNKAQAEQLAKFLNENNENTTHNDFKLKNDELFFVYEIDKYSKQPLYRLKSTKNCIKLAYNY